MRVAMRLAQPAQDRPVRLRRRAPAGRACCHAFTGAESAGPTPRPNLKASCHAAPGGCVLSDATGGVWPVALGAWAVEGRLPAVTEPTPPPSPCSSS